MDTSKVKYTYSKPRYKKMLNIKEMQIKIMKYNYTPIKMTKNLKIKHTRCWQGCRETELIETAGGNIKRHNFFGKHFGSSSKRQLYALHMLQSFRKKRKYTVITKCCADAIIPLCKSPNKN